MLRFLLPFLLGAVLLFGAVLLGATTALHFLPAAQQSIVVQPLLLPNSGGEPPKTVSVSYPVLAKSTLKKTVDGSWFVPREVTLFATPLASDGWLVTDSAALAKIKDPQIFLPDHTLASPEKVLSDPLLGVTYLHLGKNVLPTLRFADTQDMVVGGTVYGVGFGETLVPNTMIAFEMPDPDTTGTIAVDAAFPRPIVRDAIGVLPGAALLTPRGALLGIGGANGTIVPIKSLATALRVLVSGHAAASRAFGLHIFSSATSVFDTPRATAGARVTAVDAAGRAAHAGIQKGDIILAVGDRPINDHISLPSLLAEKLPEEHFDMTVHRGTTELTISFSPLLP